MATDWAHLAVLGGEHFEDFVSACLLQRYPRGWQTKPGKGDGGIDFIHPTPSGFVIFQIKKFAAPLTPSQKTQVKDSWKRFQRKHVVKGKKIAGYQLVTAWTPTDGYRDWLLDDVTKGAKFERAWQGIAFLNGLAGEYPGTYARFFQGPDVLERYVMQKAMLATVPLPEAESTSFIDAVLARADNTQALLDISADHYFVNPSIRMTSPEGEVPLPIGEPGVIHQIEAIDEHRYRVISIVPKSAQSTELDPIDLSVKFLPVPATEEEQEFRDWRDWGIPFNGITGEVTQTGGPLSDPTPKTGILQIVPEPVPERAWPPLKMERQNIPDNHLDLGVTEVTRGVLGGGIRIVAESISKIIRIEFRFNSQVAEPSQSISLSGIAGNTPKEVEHQLRILVDDSAPILYTFSAEGNMLFGVSLDDAEWIKSLHRLAADLVTLQQHVTEQIVFPELHTITSEQESFVGKLAAALRGDEQELPWRDVLLTVGLDASAEFAKFGFPGILVIPAAPMSLLLGNSEYKLNKLLQQNYSHPQTPSGFDHSTIRKGDVVKLTQGPTSRLTICLPEPQWFNQQYVWIE